MPQLNAERSLVSRRAFLQGGALFLAGAACDVQRVWGAESTKSVLRIGLLTDMHFADKPAGGTRYYRETPDKLAEAGRQFEKDKPEFIVELGDFIDAAASVKTELSYLKRIDKEFSALPGKKYYVLGNHCVDTLKKEEFLGEVGQKKSYYSFDAGERHFVVLDSCFRSDGVPYERKNFKWTDPNVPPAELEWLKADLQSTKKPAVVFAHQRLDVATAHGVKNAPAVRRVLEASGKVQAVFQGHSHKNDHKEIAGIHYCTLVAMVEGSGAASNGYSTLGVLEDGSLKVSGFRKQEGYAWDGRV